MNSINQKIRDKQNCLTCIYFHVISKNLILSRLVPNTNIYIKCTNPHKYKPNMQQHQWPNHKVNYKWINEFCAKHQEFL